LSTSINDFNLQISKTLLNYKTEYITEQKLKVESVVKDIESIKTNIDNQEQQLIDTEAEIDKLNHRVFTIEEQIRIHQRESIIQNGRMNLSHGNKKKRLDTELEQMLQLLETNNNTVTTINENIINLQFQRSEKTAILNELEQSIAEVLISQQKSIYQNNQNILKEGKELREFLEKLLANII
jgi:chromosome segregation ATPase